MNNFKLWVTLAIAMMSQFVLLNAQDSIVNITVSGSCGMCKDRIEEVAVQVIGVQSADYDLDNQNLRIAVQSVFQKSELVSALLLVGHDADGQKASNDVYNDLPECCWYRPISSDTESSAPINVDNDSISEDTLKISVSGACGSCKSRIEKAALSVIGVTSANYDILAQQLSVTTEDLFKRTELVSAILLVGHDTEGQVAKESAYNDLPGCCLYREVPIHLEESSDDQEDHSGHNHGDTKPAANKKNNTLSGTVYEKASSEKMVPVIGAYVLWEGQKGGTVTDLDGNFEIEMSKKTKNLVVTYVGYSPDTIAIDQAGIVSITISTPNLLDAIEITHKKRTTEISYLQTVKVQNISSKELLKAACCNLAESFDTTPAIDASNTDAITGTRKIEMLGLAGPYVQITQENIPSVRGLSAIQGLSFVPGPWVESMQLNMGAGSVVNGFESMTGQINVELKKPSSDEDMYFNAYGSQAARLEMNHFAKQVMNEEWSTATLLHASARSLRRDKNSDGFLDIPLGKQFGFINRWEYSDGAGKEAQLGMKLSYVDNVSGQNDFDPVKSDRTAIWGANMETTRAEVWAKRGYVDIDSPYKSLGIQFAGVYHDQNSQFGNRVYDATQKSIYFNMIYQSIIDNTDHQVRMGTSFQWDQFDEQVATSNYKRNEWVPGIFGEYTYKGSEKFSVLLGGRADYHNNFGLFFTPRANVRYAPNESTVFRIAAGRGQRTQSIFAENIGLFASNREINIKSQNEKNPYGLNAEVSWNIGASVTKEFPIGSRNLLVSLDLNRIQFENQIVVDFDQSPQQVWFYNLSGQSYSNSAQLQLEIDAAKWLDIRLAYRYNDVKTTYGEKLLRKPLVSPQRAFMNLDIKPGKGWSIDYTINWLNSVRIPSTASNPIQYQWEGESPSYFLSNAQVSKSWSNGFEVYLGGENIFNYRLQDPIIAADEPFGKFFDSSLAWGPIMGTNIYTGIRMTLK